MSKGSISKKEIPTPEKGVRKTRKKKNFHVKESARNSPTFMEPEGSLPCLSQWSPVQCLIWGNLYVCRAEVKWRGKNKQIVVYAIIWNEPLSISNAITISWFARLI
jgi:hypothetical protein